MKSHCGGTVCHQPDHSFQVLQNFCHLQTLVRGGLQLLSLRVPLQIWHLHVLIQDVKAPAFLHHIVLVLGEVQIVHPVPQSCHHGQGKLMPQRILGRAVACLPRLGDLDEVREYTPSADVDVDQELMFCQERIQRVLLPQNQFAHELEQVLVGALGLHRQLLGFVALVSLGHASIRCWILVFLVLFAPSSTEAKLLKLSRAENILPNGGCLVHVQLSHLVGCTSHCRERWPD